MCGIPRGCNELWSNSEPFFQKRKVVAHIVSSHFVAEFISSIRFPSSALDVKMIQVQYDGLGWRGNVYRKYHT